MSDSKTTLEIIKNPANSGDIVSPEAGPAVHDTGLSDISGPSAFGFQRGIVMGEVNVARPISTEPEWALGADIVRTQISVIMDLASGAVSRAIKASSNPKGLTELALEIDSVAFKGN